MHPDDDVEDVEDFCRAACDHGLVNNADLQAMRWHWCWHNQGAWFGTWADDLLIAVSGCHALPEVSDRAYRVLFRGCSRPGYENYLAMISKTHMNSLPFFQHVPMAAEWAKAQGRDQLVITTNHDNPAGLASMHGSHRVLGLLSRQGLVTKLTDMQLFGTPQSIWLLDMQRYAQVRREFAERHGLH